MNSYEAKQEARKERFERLSGKASAESNRRYNASAEITKYIPMGQPILVGHHSEGRHRAALKRSDQNMRACIEADKKAEYYADKANGVGQAGISSDDPEAVIKLLEKLEGLEKGQARMKEINADYRKAKGDIDKMKTVSPELMDRMKKEKTEGYTNPDRYRPFPSWSSLSNNNAEIRRCKQRIEQLLAEANRVEAHDIEGNGWTISENKEDNRVRIEFDSKPTKEVCSLLNANGWRWSPFNKAWQRHLNNQGRNSARYVTGLIDKGEF